MSDRSMTNPATGPNQEVDASQEAQVFVLPHAGRSAV